MLLAECIRSIENLEKSVALKISTFENKTQEQVVVEGNLISPMVKELLFIVHQQRSLADLEGREVTVAGEESSTGSRTQSVQSGTS